VVLCCDCFAGVVFFGVVAGLVCVGEGGFFVFLSLLSCWLVLLLWGGGGGIWGGFGFVWLWSCFCLLGALGVDLGGGFVVGVFVVVVGLWLGLWSGLDWVVLYMLLVLVGWGNSWVGCLGCFFGVLVFLFLCFFSGDCWGFWCLGVVFGFFSSFMGEWGDFCGCCLGLRWGCAACGMGWGWGGLVGTLW